MTKTNFEMVKELQNWYPEEMHFISGEEVEYITKVMELKERRTLDLRNLRDFTVLYYNHVKDMHQENKDWDSFTKEDDKLSAITAVIDQELSNRGYLR